MTTKVIVTGAVNGREDKQRAALDGHLEKMACIRKRMKSTDATIHRSLDAAWAILRHVQTNH